MTLCIVCLISSRWPSYRRCLLHAHVLSVADRVARFIISRLLQSQPSTSPLDDNAKHEGF